MTSSEQARGPEAGGWVRLRKTEAPSLLLSTWQLGPQPDFLPVRNYEIAEAHCGDSHGSVGPQPQGRKPKGHWDTPSKAAYERICPTILTPFSKL